MTEITERLTEFARDRLDDCYSVYKETDNYKELQQAIFDALTLIQDRETVKTLEDAYIRHEDYSNTMAYLHGLKDGLKLNKL